ncbi:MAG TPA: SRPBCC domain-containing protein [Nocardioides sp.]|nr:SRPBCC domain-containing protein [Nocardioides sp.]
MTESTITIRRTVSSAPDRVFAAWTDVAQLARWWWPQLAGTTYDVDARPGGRFRIQSPVIGATVSGVYTEVDPPRRLVFTWVWEDDDEPQPAVEDSVVVTFEPTDDGTLVTVAHTSTAHVPEGGAEQGWNDVLDRLVRLGVGSADQSTSSRS